MRSACRGASFLAGAVNGLAGSTGLVAGAVAEGPIGSAGMLKIPPPLPPPPAPPPPPHPPPPRPPPPPQAAPARAAAPRAAASATLAAAAASAGQGLQLLRPHDQV